eukprot:m.293651 g.293651  ORF g.293651 m.293651 type:complete len:252 (+) comp27965_c0_seq1:477-1232(+)
MATNTIATAAVSKFKSCEQAVNATKELNKALAARAGALEAQLASINASLVQPTPPEPLHRIVHVSTGSFTFKLLNQSADSPVAILIEASSAGGGGSSVYERIGSPGGVTSITRFEPSDGGGNRAVEEIHLTGGHAGSSDSFDMNTVSQCIANEAGTVRFNESVVLPNEGAQGGHPGYVGRGNERSQGGGNGCLWKGVVTVSSRGNLGLTVGAGGAGGTNGGSDKRFNGYPGADGYILMHIPRSIEYSLKSS